MRSLNGLRGHRTRLAGALLAASLALPAALAAVTAFPAAAAHAAAAAAQDPASGGCYYQQVNGGYQWVCSNTTGTGGSPGSAGGGGPTSACTLTPLSRPQATFLGLPWPAPASHTWEAITCPGAQPFGGATLVSNATGAPAVTPQQLSQIAVGELIIPAPAVATAPPTGRDGLVGLPEWFWVSNWHPVSRTVTAGPVWATATAVPEKLIFHSGDANGGASCAGPGTAYRTDLPPGAQHTDCSYTYVQPSASQPGAAYEASVTVLWNVSWVGSGGAGGVVATGRPVSTPLTLRVAAGEALVTGG